MSYYAGIEIIATVLHVGMWIAGGAFVALLAIIAVGFLMSGAK